MVKRAKGSIGKIDQVVLACFGLLVIIGWLSIYASSYDPEHPNIFDVSMNYGKQFLWIISALILGASIFLFEYSAFKEYGYWVYLVAIVLLIAVLLFGKEVNGSRSWFGVGSLGIQPSEFAKIAAALAVARFMSSLTTRLRDLKTRVLASLIFLFPAGLIVLQGDTGTALVFVAFLLVLYREGLSGNILLIFFLAGLLSIVVLLTRETSVRIVFTDWAIPGKIAVVGAIVAIATIIFFMIRRFSFPRYRRRAFTLLGIGLVASILYILTVDFAFENVLDDHQQTRVNILLGIEEDPQGAGWNVIQSKTAIGAGGLSGKGYLQGPLTKYGYVPMQSTDFIFCTIGEEWGFLGGTIVIIIYMVLLARLIQMAEHQRSSFNRIYIYSVACILFLHVMINVGMTIGLAPVIGIPLPFFSYGGSSLWAFTILLFVAVKLDSERLDFLR